MEARVVAELILEVSAQRGLVETSYWSYSLLFCYASDLKSASIRLVSSEGLFSTTALAPYGEN
jgi:hypothetical protein